MKVIIIISRPWQFFKLFEGTTCMQSAKKIIFTACHLLDEQNLFHSSSVIQISQKHHLPVRQVKNRIHEPDSKVH